MSEDVPETPETVPRGIVVAGRYRVERRLGTGGMGEVYLVQHIRTDERFAMKVLLSQTISDKTALDRFQREARTTARIESDHVVRVTDADVAPELNGAPFLVMEYLKGEDLDRHVQEYGPMVPRDVVMFLQQVARALDKAHSHGIVHRDLKPENIFITRREDGSPHLKILDFGIAKFTSSAMSDLVSKTATSPGQIYGTPLYMAPEQAKGESKRISPQTDLWALGLIANRMLTGKDYWDAETLTALIAQVVYEPMQKPSEKGFHFGDAYDQWFLRCCNRDPDARFGSAGELVFKLGQALGVVDGDATFTGGGPPSFTRVSTPAASIGSSAPRPLSKTELQLAQTGLSEPTGRADRGTFLKVAIGSVAAIAIVAVAVLLTRGPSTSQAGTASTDSPRTATTATGPTVVAVDTSTSAQATAAATTAPGATASAAASAPPTQEPTASATESAAAASADPSGKPSTGPKGRTKPPTTAKASGGPATPPPPPPPQPSSNMLDGRL